MPERQPAPDPVTLLTLLRAHQTAEMEFRAYVLGVLAGLGIPRERFTGIDDATGDLLLADQQEEPAD